MYERKNLILDYATNPFTFDLKLTNDIDDLDFDSQGSLSDKGLITSNLVFYYDFDYYTDITTANSLYPYKDARPSGSTMVLNSSGATISYQTDTYINKKYVALDGGYYSGIFMSGITTGSTSIPYQVVPSPAPIGYTLNFWLNVGSNASEGYFFKIGDETSGYGFYYKDGRLGYKNYVERVEETGNTIIITQTGSSNLIFTGSTGNSWINITVVFKRNQPLVKCCNECDDNLYDIIYEPFPDCIDLDHIPDTNKGTLTFYVNGRPAYKVVMEEPIIKTYEIMIGKGFVGGISIASMYDKPLTIPEIIRNYYGLKDIYKRPENFGGINTIVNSNLTK